MGSSNVLVFPKVLVEFVLGIRDRYHLFPDLLICVWVKAVGIYP